VPAVALALLLLARAGAPAGAAAPAACPADARVEVNLAAWRMSLEQPDSGKRRDELLGEVKLALELPEPEPPDAREARVTLEGIDDTAVQLEAGGRLDHVLQLRYRVGDGEDRPMIYLVQVLRPLEGRAFCALGADLTRGDEGAAKLVSYELAFVPLVSAKAKAIEVQRVEGEARLSETRRAYWIARGFKLEKIFDEALGQMRSTEGGATTTTVATIALAGDFPRRIELTETTKHGGCEVRAGNTPCDDGGASTKTTFVYDGTKYAKRK
jgi:hypothetical protein